MNNIASLSRKTVSIPFKIKRSPTDLLQALSKTVELDSTGPAYSLIDDRGLTPLNVLDIKRYNMARAYGVKAAQFVIEKYPQGFMKNDAEPQIQSFLPQKAFSEEELKYPNESLIFSLISWGKFKDAYKVYLKCKDQGIEVSEPCKMALLDFSCIHNGQDLGEKVPISELWHTRSTKYTEEMTNSNRNTWKSNVYSQSIFNDLKLKTSQAYCSLIKGMAKLNELEAFNEYENMKKAKLTPDLNTLNELISLVGVSDESLEGRMDHILKLFNEMNKYGIQPNLRTFNNALNVLRTMMVTDSNIKLTLNIIKEMDTLKIEPSLATWSHVVTIFCNKRDYYFKPELLMQILDRVEKQSNSSNGIEWRDVNDPSFFKNAMGKCLLFKVDLDVIYRLHALLMKDNNIRFLNCNYLRERYFDSFFKALVKSEKPNNVIIQWRTLVPYILVRSPYLVSDMIKFTVANYCFDFVPEIWTDFHELRVKKNIDFCSENIKILLSFMNQYSSNDDVCSYDDLLDKFASIAKIMINYYPYLASQENMGKQREGFERVILEYKWTASMLSDLISIAIKADRLDFAFYEFNKFFENQRLVPGELSEEIVTNLFESALKPNQVDKAIMVLSYMFTINRPLAKEWIKRLKSKENLFPRQIDILDSLLIK